MTRNDLSQIVFPNKGVHFFKFRDQPGKKLVLIKSARRQTKITINKIWSNFTYYFYYYLFSLYVTSHAYEQQNIYYKKDYKQNL